MKRITYWSKPWWAELFSELRKADNFALRSSKRDRFDTSLLTSATSVRSAYCKAIKGAKRAHWSSCLATATPQTVWTAKKFALCLPPPCFPELPGASTPLELNTALLGHFFPGEPVKSFDTILLSFKDCSALAMGEIGRALACSSPLSAPGPDKTPNSLWKRIHHVGPHPIHNLLGLLVANSFHPPALKKADGNVVTCVHVPLTVHRSGQCRISYI